MTDGLSEAYEAKMWDVFCENNDLLLENDQLAAENAKLRELVRDMAVVICVYDQCVTVDDCPPALPMFADKMRELGIGVDA